MLSVPFMALTIKIMFWNIYFWPNIFQWVFIVRKCELDRWFMCLKIKTIKSKYIILSFSWNYTEYLKSIANTLLIICFCLWYITVYIEFHNWAIFQVNILYIWPHKHNVRFHSPMFNATVTLHCEFKIQLFGIKSKFLKIYKYLIYFLIRNI